MTKQWTFQEAKDIFYLPFPELICKAQEAHRAHFDPTIIQTSTLLNIKTGSCPENCSYCPQSAHYKTGLEKEPLMEIETVLEAAKKAKEAGSSRFCMGAAWRGPRDSDLDKVCEMVKEIKKLGLESCVTLGLLKDNQAEKLKEAGVDFYNHNIDTSEEFYDKIITTRTFQDRIDTLEKVREAGLKVCCGVILGMGESDEDRLKMLVTLANFYPHPESVPINKLIRIPGTPLAEEAPIDSFTFVRTIALAKIMMPSSHIRLSAGREEMSEEFQALCFLAGVSSIFYGEKLLTTSNPLPVKDTELLEKLGLRRLQ